MPETLQPDLELDIHVAKIKGKKLTTTLFNQLLYGQPYGNNYELLYEIKGRVFKSAHYVIFSTPEGPRKFDIKYFLRKERENTLAESLYSCVSERSSPKMELENIRYRIQKYYRKLVDREREDPGLYIDTIEELLDGKSNHRQMDDIQEYLVRELQGDFKTEVEAAFEEGQQKKKNFNHMIDVFYNAPQIFL